jgi:ATP-dependent exoDNAse (exonuclease V) beta subunit
VPADLLARWVRIPRDLSQPVIALSGSDDRCQAAELREASAWTDEQQDAIERRDGDLLLAAGAGSGKTSVLVERFVRSVLDDGVEVSSILTITFTEKAAAELRDRIRLRLRELGAADTARATEGAFISTIHGFCARVLRGHALAAGLDPDFAVLDRPQSEPIAVAAFDEALQALAGDSERGVELVAAYGVGPLRGTILSIYAQLRSAGALVPRLPAVQPAAVTAAGHELELAAGALAAELAGIASPGPQVVSALGRVERARELAGIGDLWPGMLGRLRLPGGNGAALATDACVAYREALDAFRDQLGAVAAAPVRDLLDRLLVSFGERYAERKRAVSGVDFEDLELLSRDLLRSDTELRERYAARFARIMVDEFQDTNRVQLELIESIARGNLFTVGDAQQSIYGFRHADVELFERRGQALEAAGARQTLLTNFRSRPEILAALNLAFADELGERLSPLRPGRPPQGGDTVEAEPGVELLLVDKGADWELEGLASPWRLAEARALADRVAELVQAGAAPGEIVVLIRATTDMRAYERALERRGLPTYVIGGRGYWAHPQIVDMVAYLRALANPRDEESLYSVLASPLVGVSLDALVVVGAAARTCGRDPWWLLRDPEGAGEAARALDSLTADDRQRLSRFVSWFADERAGAARRGIEDLIDGAVRGNGYDLAMLAMPGGRRRLANVRKLMRLGREYEAAHGASLRGFVEFIAERVAGRAGDSRESEAPVEGDGLDAVRLMTIHRAKGLEFEIVCVADLGRSVRPASQIVRVSRDGRLGLRLARTGVGGRESVLAYKELGDEQRQAEESEERRLFYVAMTRARERLVLSGAAKLDGWTDGGATGGGPVAWIAPAFFPQLGALIGEGGGVVQRDGVSLALRLVGPGDSCGEAGPVDRPAASPSPAPAVRPEPAVPPAPSGTPAAPVSSLSYSSLGEYARCGYRFYAERVLGLPSAAVTESAAEAAAAPASAPGMAADAAAAPAPAPGMAADARGILVHALLERLDFRRPVTPAAEAIVAAAARAGIAPSPTPDEAAELAALIEAFGAAELRARLGRARDLRREERFAFVLAGGVLVTGALDVLAHEPGGRMLIVDYKSDRLRGEAPAAIVGRAYGTQRLVYALAALRSGAAVVEVVHCFLERPAETVAATFASSDMGRLEGQLEALADGVVNGRFEVSPTPHRGLCAGCPAEGGLCSWPLEQTRRQSPDQLF